MEEEEPSQKKLRQAVLFKAPSLGRGQVRVAKYYPGKSEPETPGFRNVLIHVSSSGLGGTLSPFVLRNEKGQLLENVWQFSKLYPAVTQQRIPLSRFRKETIIWEHPAEVHVNQRSPQVVDQRSPQVVDQRSPAVEPTPAYWAWRKKGENNHYAVRYPNGFHGRTTCICSLWQAEPDGPFERLGYIEARKKIYCGEYRRLAPQTGAFQRLLSLLAQGMNLQLVEVDGPDPTLTFPPYNEISKEQPGLLMGEDTIRLLIDDSRKPFGHGYAIAALLLGGSEWIQ
jgi:hypothetical protein